jgi:hypothetical protein
MVSKSDLTVGILVLIAGIIDYEFAPGGILYQPMPAHTMTHYVGATIGVAFGLIGLALYKKINKVTLGVSVLSILLGIVFALDAPPSGILFRMLQPHALAMETVGGLTALVGIIAIIAASTMTRRPNVSVSKP